MVNLLTSIPLYIKDFHINNFYSLNASNSQYPSDMQFYTEVSTRMIYDKLDYLIKSSPGYKPVHEVVEDDLGEASLGADWCEHGF